MKCDPNIESPCATNAIRIPLTGVLVAIACVSLQRSARTEEVVPEKAGPENAGPVNPAAQGQSERWTGPLRFEPCDWEAVLDFAQRDDAAFNASEPLSGMILKTHFELQKPTH